MAAQTREVTHEQMTQFLAGVHQGFALDGSRSWPRMPEPLFPFLGYYAFAKALGEGFIEPDRRESTQDSVAFRLTEKGRDTYTRGCLETLPQGKLVGYAVVVDAGLKSQQIVRFSNDEEACEVYSWYRQRPYREIDWQRTEEAEALRWKVTPRKCSTVAVIEGPDGIEYETECLVLFGDYPTGLTVYRAHCMDCKRHRWFYVEEFLFRGDLWVRFDDGRVLCPNCESKVY